MLCSICFNEIPVVGDWVYGNSASPVNQGRCCNRCDNEVVIPARLAMSGNKVSTAVYIDMLREQVKQSEEMLAAYNDLKMTAAPAV